MIALYLFAFLSGLITIFAPCIWPILPIVLSASAQAGRRRPLGISVGLIISFTAATLLLSYVVRSFQLDPDILRWVAVGVIAALGLVLLFPRLSAYMEAAVSRLQNRLGTQAQTQRTGFSGGLITGFALGFIWTPCAGPILATIVTLASTQAVTAQVIILTLSYTLGVAVPLFILALVGQKLFHYTEKFNRYTGRVQQVFGGVMILTAAMIGTGYDRTLQAKLLDAFPSYSNFVVALESNDSVLNQLDSIMNRSADTLTDRASNTTAGSALPDYGPAPDIIGTYDWFNMPNNAALQLNDLRGKVVLIDFWTYTCINCIRTLPYVQSWYEKYEEAGLVIIGVHTPEFEFEKDPANVAAAIQDYGLTYPVALDNDYETWKNYDNHYWPAKYLIDANGHVRYYHFGEGEYEVTEQAIQALLAEAGTTTTATLTEEVADPNFVAEQTPEIYLGTARAEHFHNDQPLRNGDKNYLLPAYTDLDIHEWSLGGEWAVNDEAITTKTQTSLALRFIAQDVYLVITSPDEAKMNVILDGQPIRAEQAGADVQDSIVELDEARLYHLVHLPDGPEEHVLQLDTVDSGIELYAFTFGS